MTPELVQRTLRLAPGQGTSQTPEPALAIVRSDRRLPRMHTVHRPSLCFLVQGAKEVTAGGAVLRYGAGQFLFSTVELPTTGEIFEATPRLPYLCLVLELDPRVVFELVLATEGGAAAPRPSRTVPAAIVVGAKDAAMADAFLRLLRCFDHALDTRVLAPTITREITYRLLRGPYAAGVRELGIADSQTQRISRVIEQLKAEFAKPLRASTLAAAAGMSVSSFHHYFKQVTRLSPLQYQKLLRLHEARRLLLGHAAGAADVAFQVGYASASQFSREYTRQFGLPPRSDARMHAPR